VFNVVYLSPPGFCGQQGVLGAVQEEVGSREQRDAARPGRVHAPPVEVVRPDPHVVDAAEDRQPARERGLRGVRVGVAEFEVRPQGRQQRRHQLTVLQGSLRDTLGPQYDGQHIGRQVGEPLDVVRARPGEAEESLDVTDLFPDDGAMVIPHWKPRKDDPEKIALADGRFTVGGTARSVGLTEVAKASFLARRMPRGMELGLDAKAVVTPPGGALSGRAAAPPAPRVVRAFAIVEYDCARLRQRARGYARLYVEHVLQADEGADFDFLVGGDEVAE